MFLKRMDCLVVKNTPRNDKLILSSLRDLRFLQGMAIQNLQFFILFLMQLARQTVGLLAEGLAQAQARFCAASLGNRHISHLSPEGASENFRVYSARIFLLSLPRLATPKNGVLVGAGRLRALRPYGLLSQKHFDNSFAVIASLALFARRGNPSGGDDGI